MARNILIFADGTGNESGLIPDESRTNVYKLFRATRVDPESNIKPTDQIAFYISGIGTLSAGPASRGKRAKATIQKMFGGGLIDKITECYAAIISVWRPGDRIYLFGFSRGAYTVRCLAHVLEIVGIPTKGADGGPISLEPKSLRKLGKEAVKILYKFNLPVKDKNRRNKLADKFVAKHACLKGKENNTIPYFIGVWDTVAAIGWTHIFNLPYDMRFPPDVPFARHAMAIDEYRKDFVRVPWGGSQTIPTEPLDGVKRFDQVWFAGNHSDIGGSYPETESRLSDIALAWMANFASKELPSEGRIKINEDRLNCFPSSDGMMHDECMIGVGGTRFRWFKGTREVPPDHTLHETVYERLKMDSVRNYVGYGPYRPLTLKNYPKAKSYFQSADTPASSQ